MVRTLTIDGPTGDKLITFTPCGFGAQFTAAFGEWYYTLSWDSRDPNNQGWWLEWWRSDEDGNRIATDGCPIDGEDDDPDWDEVALIIHDRRCE